MEKLKARVVDARTGLSGKIEFAERRAKRAGETALPGGSAVLQAQVPLAGHAGGIARVAQHFAQGEASLAQPARVALRSLANVGIQVTHAGVMRIEAGKQRGARGAAAGGVVELREAQ